MFRIFVMLAFAALALPSCSPSGLSPEASSWWSHVERLASDSLQGRNTGSAGYRSAAEYVAAEFAAAGVKPGGIDGYFQPVSFVSRTVRESESTLSLVRNGSNMPLRLGEDANLGMSHDWPEAVEAKAVFVGYGIKIPEIGYDDFAGQDLRGKLAFYLRGGPSSVAGPLRAHAQSTEERWKHLRAAGAIGTIGIANPKNMDTPWERATLRRLQASMGLADPALDETPGNVFSINVNPTHAETFFAGSPHAFPEILALADSGVQLPRFPMPIALRAQTRYTTQNLECMNVVGILPGSDPVLKDEYVVLSAHLDHLGVGGAVEGDSIYNGAMDNASGIATMIEIARLVKKSGTKLRRSLVLLAVTGEEKGLEGSRYYSLNPTVPAAGIVANVNMDMFLPIVPFEVLTVYGLNESDLGDWVRPIVERAGARVQDDPEPNRNIFTRSDQYNFIRRGVPALSFKFGAKKGSPEEKVLKDWIHNRYHAPSDDLSQPVDQEAAVQFTRMLLDFCADIANRDERPRWKDDSFFKRFAEPTTAAATGH